MNRPALGRLDVVPGTRPDVDDASRPGIDELLGVAHLDDGSLVEARVRQAAPDAPPQVRAWLRLEARARASFADDALPRFIGTEGDRLALARARGVSLRSVRVARVEQALAVIDDVARVCEGFAGALAAALEGAEARVVPLLPTRDDVVIAEGGAVVTSAPYDWTLRRLLAAMLLDGTRPWETIGPAALRDEVAPVVDDAWCLGVIAYRLITSEGPIDAAMRRADSDLARLEAIRVMPVAPLRTLAPAVPARVDDLVMRLLAREPRDAFESYAELRAELAACRALFPDVTRADVAGLAAGFGAGLSLPPSR